MKRCNQFLLVAFSLILVPVQRWAFAQDLLQAKKLTQIEGLTQKWTKADDKDPGRYDHLPNVMIIVARHGSYVTSEISKSTDGRKAEFKFTVLSGEPIDVIFHLSKKYVPEMQSLSAQAGLVHRVSAALHPVDQYRRLRGNSSLREKLRCIEKHVPEKYKNEILEMIKAAE